MTRIKLCAPVMFLTLAAIAIPIEILSPGHYSTVDLRVDPSHAFVNVLGFVPAGFVLGEFGVLQALAAAALMSGLAETGQIAMMYRGPSVWDFIANVIGALLGAVMSAHWKIRSPTLKINRWTTFVAAAAALALMAKIWVQMGPPVSKRGATSPGTLEAYWKLDEKRGRVAPDSSGHSLNGQFISEPELVLGPMGTSVMFDGKKEYIEVGRSTALRLAGSMTITAWINSSSFPYDDAAIVSQLHSRSGYQLDTAIDKGARTIGFKLSNPCGHLMARYGATPLVIGTWYHVAGVYDAPRRTLDVYLNGKLDNGPLVGPVARTQHSSRWPVYLGRRSDLEGYGFAGLIRDVRIYSFPLTSHEIAAVMRGESVNGAVVGRSTSNANEAGRSTQQSPPCTVTSEHGDQWIPVMAASLGVLVAVSCVTLWASASPVLYAFLSFVAGLLLLPALVPNVPAFNLWLIPLVTFAGGVSVAVSIRRYADS